MAGNSVEEIHKTRKQFVYVLIALGVLTVITIAVSFLDFGVKANMTLGMAIATVKASLVALIFMHLKSERLFVYFFLLMAAVLFIVCMFLTLAHLWDPIPAAV